MVVAKGEYSKMWCKKRFLYGILTVLISTVLAISYYHLWGTDIKVPIAGYRGDSVGLLLDVNNYVRGGNVHNNAIFGAPAVGRYRSVMADYAMMFPSLKLFWKLTGSVEAAVNIQLIFNNMILAISMYIICIQLRLTERMALIAGILLPNTSYLVIGNNAVMLTYLNCFYLPFFVYAIIKMMLPESTFAKGKEKFSAVLFLIVTMFLTGVNSLYYAFFCLIILIFVGIYTLCGMKSVKNTLLVILSFISVGYGIGVCIMPDILHAAGLDMVWESGAYYVLCAVGGMILIGLAYVFYKKVYPKMTIKRLVYALLGLGVVVVVALLLVLRYTNYIGEYEGRTLYAVELGALNIANLFLPSANNICDGVDKMVAVLTDIDNPQMNDAAQMGVFTGIGLMYSIGHIFQFGEKKDTRDYILEICGKCNCVIILLAVKGGAASAIAAYITTGIRNYSRICIIIMIFSMISFGILVDKIIQKICNVYEKEKRFAATGIVLVVVVIGIVVSIPTHYIYQHNFGLVHYEDREAEYDKWQDLILSIEDSVEDGTMILELPSSVEGVYWGELMTVGRAYELSVPAIVSKSTIWSYGCGMVPEVDIVSDTQEYIDSAMKLGFGGIYLDAMMYSDASYKQCIDALEKCLGPADVSDGFRRYFWKF